MTTTFSNDSPSSPTSAVSPRSAQTPGSADSATTPSDAHLPDVDSDPAANVELGHDWSAEGGALPTGPAVPTSPGHES